MKIEASKHKISCIVPNMNYCMDNAAMIGYIAEKKIEENKNNFSNFDFIVVANALRSKKNKIKIN
jgi:tRNA A37 threonylcarbamoyltransferase TsaD